MNTNPSTMTLEDAKKLIDRIDKMTYKERRELAEAFIPPDAFQGVDPVIRNSFKIMTVTPTEGEMADRLYILLGRMESGEWIAEEAALDTPVGQLIDRLWNNERLRSYKEAAALENIPIKQMSTHPVTDVIYPLDKVNSVLWSMNESGDAIKGLQMNSRNKKAILIFKTLWDEQAKRIPKHLDQFDKAVYIAAAALYRAGNTSCITPTHIHHAMGNTSQPSRTQVERINDSLTKMSVRIQIDNSKEAAINKSHGLFTYDGDLLPFERVTEKARIDGSFVDSYIHLLAEPPLIRLACQYGQFTTLSPTLLMNPLNQTITTLSVKDYLIRRIAHAKTGNGHKKMLYSTIFEKCGINANTEKERQRAIEKIKTFLDQYVGEEFILGYSLLEDGVQVSIKQPPKKPKRKKS